MEIYLDHAATTRIAPESLQAMIAFEQAGRGNPFRGLHAAAERATEAYEQSRETVARFFGAPAEHIVFTKGTTEGLNMLARGLAETLQEGDEIILSLLEHHAHLLPWRAVAEKRKCVMRFVPLTREGEFDVGAYRAMLSPRTKVVAVTHVSNVLGSVVPLEEIVQGARAMGAFVCVDGAQAAGHMQIDVVAFGVDAYAMSAHKMYGPLGIGSLYLSARLQEVLQPFLLGGGMIEEVLDDGCPVFAEGVRKYEAGTPNVTGAVGFAAACTVLLSSLQVIKQKEQMLTKMLWEGLSSFGHITLYGPPPERERRGVIAFAIEGRHSHDVAQELSQRGIALRAGFHCAAPLARCLNPHGVLRVSIGRDTSEEECRIFLSILHEVIDKGVY
ncbi:cysteine desulfurase [bacterium]|nr:cysteine desulfurase [bacterium]